MSWEGKRVLITGAGGFIGSHLAEQLVKLGANVKGLVHYNALGTLGWLGTSLLRQEIEVILGDISDYDSVHQAMQKTEIVFHLAALIGIPYSYHAPRSYVRTNIEGTLNVLQAGRALETERIVHTSTSEVYGTAQYVPIDEKHPQQGQSPYSASKIGADKLAEAFHLSFGLPITTVRPFNTFGPRQSTRAVIPTIISQCLNKNEKIQLGALTPTRDLNYVSDTVNGFIKAASAPQAIGKVINVGSGKEISIGKLAQLIADLMSSSIYIETDKQRLRPENSEVERLLANNTVARNLLGWEPTVSLEEGLNLTISWIKEHREGYQSSDYIL